MKHIRTFYGINGVKIELEEPPKRGQVTFKDRAPTAGELTRVLEIASPREKVVITMMALGGFREGTLSMLTYAHVKEGLEKGRPIIHIHVPQELTKGKYHDYDTFVGAEAIEFLRLYMEQRRRGSPDGRLPPEELTDKSPLIRDETVHLPNAITPKQIRRIVHNLFVRAGLDKKSGGRMYEVRVHSLRKFFKTGMIHAGVQSDYVEYFMGHTVDTYHDIQSLGIEKLLNAYARGGLSIGPKTRTNKIETLKEMIRALGMNPEQVLSKESLTEPATTHLEGDRGSQQLQLRQMLANALNDLLRQELTEQEGVKV